MPFNRIFILTLCLLLLPFSLFSCKSADAADLRASQVTDEEAPIASLTFLGDSTTAHMQQRSSLRPEQVWATKSRYLNLDSRITYSKIIAPDTGEECRIAEAAARIKPERLVITLGIDYGVYYYRDDLRTFAHYYEKLLSAISSASPQTTLILQSVFPVGRDSSSITNQMVQNANEVIAAIAKTRGLLYVDQTPILADEQGYLKPEYCFSKDGLHLTRSAYDAILAHLTATLKGAKI